MFSARVDSWLARIAGAQDIARTSTPLQTRMVDTPVGGVRVWDSGSNRPCVLFVPDGPNVIEHYAELIDLLSPQWRVVCFDMPGFGHSLPAASYTHAFDEGARAVLGVLDALQIESATLAFSCANGYYALRTARIAPDRIERLILSQTASLEAMHDWTDHVIPRVLRVPVLGQLIVWLSRRRLARMWYRNALPRTTDAAPWQHTALDALRAGGCFCLASVVQGMGRETSESLLGVSVPCTVIWGGLDRSHRKTDPRSLLACVPHAELLHFADCGHFPDLEQPARYARVLAGSASAR